MQYRALILTILYLSLQQCLPTCESCLYDNLQKCEYCISGYIWNNEVCTKIEPRNIPGYSRDCVECGINNYPGNDFRCHPCKYNCEICDNKETCIECKETFILDPDTKVCTCTFYPDDRIIDGECFCQIANHYVAWVDGVPECRQCDFTTRSETGCDPDCPTGYYDYMGLDCKKCASTCAECDDGGEKACSSCAAPFEFVEVAQMCLCPCCTIEVLGSCVPLEGMILIDGKCVASE